MDPQGQKGSKELPLSVSVSLSVSLSIPVSLSFRLPKWRGPGLYQIGLILSKPRRLTFIQIIIGMVYTQVGIFTDI